MKGVFRKASSIILVLLLCLAAIPLPSAEGAELTAVPGAGTYDRYQDVKLFNETADESGITYYVYGRATQTALLYTGSAIRIADDVILSVDSNVGGVITHREFSYTINPYILSTYPAEGAANVPLDPTITVSFSRQMNEAVLETTGNITITKVDPIPVSNISSGDFTATYDTGNYTLTIQLNSGVNLEPKATYMVTLNNILDSDGKPLQGNTSFTFNTVASGDSTTYGYVTTDRTSYGPGHAVPINVTYFQGGNEVTGTVDLQVQVFDPRGVLDDTIPVTSVTDGKYRITSYTLPNNAMAGTWTVRLYDGNTPRQLLDTCTFTVVESAVTQLTADLQTGVYYEPITVNLSTPTPGVDIYYTIDYVSDYNVDPVPVSIQDSEIDSSCTPYRGPIPISEPGKTRLRAVAIKGGVKSPVLDETYTIRAELGYLNLTPLDGATGVSVLSPVSVTFGRAVKSATVNSQTFRLRDADTNTPVLGTVSYNAEKRIATFKPATLLKPNTDYEATLDGYSGGLDTVYIEDLNGDRLTNDVTWTFTTGSDWITVDGRPVVNNQVSVNKTPATVVVTSPGANMVIMNKVQMAPVGSDRFTGEVALKPGNNNVTIEITDNSAVKTTLKVTVNYLNLLQVGAGVTASIPAKGKLDLFDKQLTLDFPKGTYLRDPSDPTGLPLADQSIAFNVFQDVMPDGFPAVSLMYDIQPKVPGALLNNMGEGTITLTYDKYVSATSGSTLTVLCDPDSDGVWEENLGGKVDTKKRTITVPFSSFGRYVAVNKVWSFTDYSTAGWARAYVEYLWSKGYMKPLPTAGIGQFGLVDAQGQEIPITRGEFAVLMAKVLGLNKANYTNYGIFTDMRLFENATPPYAMATDLDGYWKYIDDDDYKYIDMLARNGIIHGSMDDYGNLVFNYFNIISREEVAVILARAMNLAVEADDVKVKAAITKMYTDANTSIAAWAQPYVLAVSKGYFGGYPDKTFRGKDNFTRPQAASIVYKAMKKNKLM
ncbi:MAG: Ig-like domain-containing protein [Bacillota bacterium]